MKKRILTGGLLLVLIFNVIGCGTGSSSEGNGEDSDTDVKLTDEQKEKVELMEYIQCINSLIDPMTQAEDDEVMLLDNLLTAMMLLQQKNLLGKESVEDTSGLSFTKDEVDKFAKLLLNKTITTHQSALTWEYENEKYSIPLGPDGGMHLPVIESLSQEGDTYTLVIHHYYFGEMDERLGQLPEYNESEFLKAVATGYKIELEPDSIQEIVLEKVKDENNNELYTIKSLVNQ